MITLKWPYLETGLEVLLVGYYQNLEPGRARLTIHEHRLELLGAITADPVVDFGKCKRVLSDKP